MRLALALVVAAVYTLAVAAPAGAVSAGVIVHEAPDKNYDGAFIVACRTGGSVVKVKEGQSSKDVCPGTGKVSEIRVKARQVIWCRVGSLWFDLFHAGNTYRIAAAQGGYLCRSMRPSTPH
jgi:hypothetical protein